MNNTVNLESDLIGKYVERLLQGRGYLAKPSISIDTEYLQKRGLICCHSGQDSTAGIQRNGNEYGEWFTNCSGVLYGQSLAGQAHM